MEDVPCVERGLRILSPTDSHLTAGKVLQQWRSTGSGAGGEYTGRPINTRRRRRPDCAAISAAYLPIRRRCRLHY